MIKVKQLSLSLMMLAITLANAVAFGPYIAYASGGQTGTVGKWTPLASQDPANFTYGGLYKVSCPAVDSCQAVGTYTDSNNNSHSIIESYDGTNWKLLPNNDPANTGSVGLIDVSCTSKTFCQAVGQYQDSSNITRGLIYTYDGTGWMAMNSPAPVSSTNTVLNRVDCVSTTFCQAVGRYQGTGVDTHAYIVTYDGTGWSIAITTDPANSLLSSLSSVDCVSTTFCQAVGASRDTSNGVHTQIQTYDGTSWSIVASPDAINTTDSAGLEDVDCLSTTFCQAVGSFTDSSNYSPQDITESYNGTNWSLETIANKGTVDNGEFANLECISTTLCVAIGAYDENFIESHPLLHMYNGTNWSATVVPIPADATVGGLRGLSCFSTTDCQVLGWYQDTGGKYHGLALSYDGTAWSSSVGLEPVGFQSAIADSIDCTSATSCQAVGTYSDTSSHYHLLLGSYAPVVLPPTDASSPASASNGDEFLATVSKAAKSLPIGQETDSDNNDDTPTSTLPAPLATIKSPTTHDGVAAGIDLNSKVDAPSNLWWWVVVAAGILAAIAVYFKLSRRNVTKG